MLRPQEYRSKLSKSHLRDQNFSFLKIDKKTGLTQIVERGFVPMADYNYRMVHNPSGESDLHHGSSLYVDPTFQIKPEQEFPDKNVIVKRLSNLYGITNLPTFFDLNSSTTTLDDCQNAPNCIKQLGLFDTMYYKRLFITQNFSQSGKYILTANIDGRFQVISVDDRVPVYKDTMQPVGDLRYDNPWEIILIKAWAKVKGGYKKAFEASAFEFIEAFSNSTWKYYNIQKEADKFLQHHSDENILKNGKIILKTQRDNPQERFISLSGIAPNSACYELLGLTAEYDQQNRLRYVVAIRGSDQAKWQGELGFYKTGSEKYFLPHMNLQHDFLMTHVEFLTIFSSAYVTSVRHEDYYSGYKILQVPFSQKKALHFQFSIQQDGFFDFNVKQFAQNRINTLGQSRLESSRIQPSQMGQMSGSRFLRNKYILVRDGQQNPLTFSHMNPSLVGSTANLYRQPRFSTYQIQYLHGYNRGDAHFVKLQKGRYILRFKSEHIDREARYALNWICSQRVSLQPARLNQAETKELLHDAMVSIMHKFPRFHFEQNGKQMITYANAFEEIGYGFVAVKCANQSNRSIALEVDPRTLKKEGYLLKGKYKQLIDGDKFCVKIERGEYAAVVFKRNPKAKDYVWPSMAFHIYKKEIKKASIQSEMASLPFGSKAESKKQSASVANLSNAERQ